MKAIKYSEKILVGVSLSALLWLIATSFNPLTGALLFFSCFILALVYLMFSPWIFSPEKKMLRPALRPILVGLALALFILAWIPDVYNWPFRLPLYKIGMTVLLSATVLELFSRRSDQALLYRKLVFKRVVIIVALASFLTHAPKELLYPLLNMNSESRILSDIATMTYRKETGEALGLARYWERNNPPGARFLRLYGEALLGAGDSSSALSMFKRSYDIDSSISARAAVLLLEKKPSFPRYTTSDHAPYLLSDELEVATPESQGLEMNILERYYSDGLRIPLLVSMMVLKNNKVVAEKYYHYSPWHVQWTFSTWKSMIGALAGIALDKGNIKSTGQVLSDFFSSETYQLQPAARIITLKDLLTMQSGINASEDGSYWEDPDPVKEILAQPVEGVPGKEFEYASRNMFLVKEIVSKASGRRFPDFCKTYADTLDVLETVFSGDDSCEWDGSCLTLRDMAKFGLLFCGKGKYRGHQIISEEWMKEATSEQVKFTEPREGYSGYGYFFWLRSINGHEIIAARGKGGQFIFCVPDKDLVIVAFGSEWNDRGFSAIENLLLTMLAELCN